MAPHPERNAGPACIAYGGGMSDVASEVVDSAGRRTARRASSRSTRTSSRRTASTGRCTAPSAKPSRWCFPRETAHVQHVMRVAVEVRVPVVPQGARSGLSGAASAIDGCILLNLEKMRDVLEIDAANRLVVTQPGIFNADLSRQVAEQGLFYPPDPSSWEFCSIGGNVSTNSGGLCCVKYGVTTDYVLGLEVVMADGEILRTGRRTVKGVAGLRPDQALRRQRGHPRRDHRDHSDAAAGDRAAADGGGGLHVGAGCRPGGDRHRRLRRRAVVAGVHGPGERASRQRGLQHGDAGRHRGAADRPERRRWRARGRRHRALRRDLRGQRRGRGGGRRRRGRGRAAAGRSPPGAHRDGEARHADDRRRLRAAHPTGGADRADRGGLRGGRA